MNIGVVVAMKEELTNILNVFRQNCSYYEESTLKEDVVLMKMRENNFYFYQSGIGQLNAVIACSKLHNQFNCKTIYNIGCCGCFIHEDPYDVGSIVEFKENIINIAFKLNPRKYHYDNANVSNYLDILVEKNNILLSSDEFLEENITCMPGLKLNKYRNVFIDMEAYGVLSYCIKNDVKYRIIKIVSDFCDETQFDKNVTESLIYNNLITYLENVLR